MKNQTDFITMHRRVGYKYICSLRDIEPIGKFEVLKKFSTHGYWNRKNLKIIIISTTSTHMYQHLQDVETLWWSCRLWPSSGEMLSLILRSERPFLFPRVERVYIQSVLPDRIGFEWMSEKPYKKKNKSVNETHHGSVMNGNKVDSEHPECEVPNVSLRTSCDVEEPANQIVLKTHS